MKKEYDSALSIDEVVSRIREKTVPFSMNPFKASLGDWARRENLDGSYTIEQSVQGRGLYTYATLKIQPMSQGTHLIFKVNPGWVIPCFLGLILSVMSLILAHRSPRNGNGVNNAAFGIIFSVCFLLPCTLLGWYKEKELIDFFESDILGIKK